MHDLPLCYAGSADFRPIFEVLFALTYHSFARLPSNLQNTLSLLSGLTFLGKLSDSNVFVNSKLVLNTTA